MEQKLWTLSVAGVLALVAGCGGGGGTLPQPVEVSSNITTNTTWSPNPAIDCDYLVTANREIEVRAALTIQAGTKVCFGANSGLKVMETGSLNAVGSAANRIVFTGTTASRGFWKGLAFRSNNPVNELSFAEVSFAGSNDSFCCDYFVSVNDIQAAVIVGSNATSTATLKLSNSLIASSANYGLYVFGNGRLTVFSTNAFSDNTKAPVALPIIEAGKLDSGSNYSGAGLVANAVNAVQVNRISRSATNVNQTLRKLNVPYAMFLGDPNTEQEYDGALTLEPGVRMEFESNTGIKIMPTGSLNAVGTAAEPIVFTGRVAAKGFWKGLAFRSNNPSNRLERVTVEYAGNDDSFCCDYFVSVNDIRAAILVGANGVTNATLALVNSTVRESDNYGVYQFSGGNTITASGNTYQNNDLGNQPPTLP
ncbi:hypothetical protein [Meiothermus taiwanensis]|jgi:hypothetical protein|uniref:Uncharacterized protein n=2 Tax=Meiothermus taiwanensis TaxID=172827 RepID=A0A399E4N1_9DEIN|nr:hypothetical protein [Meiothermus taiwanensis]AWR87172.1 hypothetical protein Mtai_v1c19380 [Meiothermus taiwanensis WR-220]KIQ55496.1 hypothetical protein SY28_03220 [Meiothermus taiwanensis]KZK14980.1 hypothetical protein A3962_11895 [Meiothermus taiwanensis]RIH78199.1 hypothetical protein Mcate_00940 [Meiothermus taiwanensis]